MYRNIIPNLINEYNANYRKIFKEFPTLSKERKSRRAFTKMVTARGFDEETVRINYVNPMLDSKGFQYRLELYLTHIEITGGIDRYYVKDESLFDFFKTTEVKQKEIESIVKNLLSEKRHFLTYGIIGKTQSYTINCLDYGDYHIITVFTDDMYYTLCIEQFDSKKSEHNWVFNLAMNFLFYINAFPECVIDGVPSDVKKNPKAKTISLSNKIVSHTTTEHGFVRPHFRSGYFRHLNSDYFVNCKGQVRFIASTMVKGKAKTVISKGEA